MQFDWGVIAEGSTSDSRGALTLVGVGQDIVETPEVPVQISRVIAFGVSDDEFVPEAETTLTLRFADPDGTVFLAHESRLRAGAPPAPGIRPHVQVGATIGVNCATYGRYEIECTLESSDGSTDRRDLSFFIALPNGQGTGN